MQQGVVVGALPALRDSYGWGRKLLTAPVLAADREAKESDVLAQDRLTTFISVPEVGQRLGRRAAEFRMDPRALRELAEGVSLVC